MRYNVQAVGKTDVGCVRSNNEDSFGYDVRAGIFVVCDGMGGAAAGEVASQIGVSTVIAYFQQAIETGEFAAFGRVFEGVSDDANALASAIQLANHAIVQAGVQSAEHSGMGSTIAAALVRDGKVSIAHVGDSRIYRVRNGTIEQLTTDHSLVLEQVRRGIISAEEAEKSELQNYIVRALGAEEDVVPDLADIDGKDGDVLLFTSDGLIRHVPDSEILRIIESSPTLDGACDALIEAAKHGGGSDNVTCVLVKLEQPWYRKIFSGGDGQDASKPEQP